MGNKYNEPAYTARHESGHAVIMTVLGVAIEIMHFLPGDTDFNGDTIPTSEGKVTLLEQVKSMGFTVNGKDMVPTATFLVAMAGPIAGAMFSGEWPPDGSPPASYKRLFEHDEGDWKVLDSGLLGLGLTDNEKDQAIMCACLQVHQVLERNWQALDALAEELIQHETLDGAAIEAVLHRRFCVS